MQGEQQARASEAQAQAAKGSVLGIFSTAIDGFSDFDPLNLEADGGA
jgi:hypothetical protein